MRVVSVLIAFIALSKTSTAAEVVNDADSVNHDATPGSVEEEGYEPIRRELVMDENTIEATVELLNGDVPEHERRELCSYSISSQGCWGYGQTIQFNINTCGGNTGEWIGIYDAGSIANLAIAANWGYIVNGGQQYYQYPLSAGYHLVTLDSSTTGSSYWPLPPGTYNVYMHTARGSYAGNPIQITTTGSCSQAPARPLSPSRRPTPAPVSRPAPQSVPQGCSYSISTQGCWGYGQTIQISISTCGGNSGEWVGIYDSGNTTNLAVAANWGYIYGGGQQDYRVAVGAGAYTITLNSETAGYAGWPLPAGIYNIYLHTSAGSFAGNPLQITTTSSCSLSTPARTPARPLPSPTNRPTSRPTPAPVRRPTPAPRPTCSYSVSTQTCWGYGQTIQVSITSCGGHTGEWIGIYYAGSTDLSVATNWAYIYGGGQQRYRWGVTPGNYVVSLNSGTTGTVGWPLAPGRYDVYYHTSQGTFATNQIQITATGSCS